MLYICFLFVFIPVILCLPTTRHDTIKLPLIRRRSLLRKRSNQLYNQQNIEYLVKLNIGTPAQEFLVSVDTGSSDLWVPSSSCPSDECMYSKFNSDKSSTYQDTNVTFNIQYGAGSIRGDYVQDKIQLDEKTSLPDQVFGLATSAKDGILSEASESNGILGLGFPTLTASSDTDQAYDPFVFNLYKKGIISKPMFSISLANEVMHVGSDGGVKDIQYVDVMKNVNPKTSKEDYTFWSVKLSGIEAENQTLVSKSQNVILDTGTTMSYLTQDIVEKMLDSVNVSYTLDKNTNLYQVKCDARDTKKTVDFSFDNKVQLKMAVEDLIMSLDGEKSCIFGFTFGFDNSDSFVFGDSVLRSTYLVFDFGNRKVGMASALNSAIQIS